MSEVWVLGGTGRSGRAIAAALRARDLEPVLVGRDQARLTAAAEGARTVRAGTVDEMAVAIRRDGPAVVVNTVGHLAEAAWHHPDLNVSYAFVTVKLMNHSAKGITEKDFELAKMIEATVLWKPAADAALEGTPDDPRFKYLKYD